MFAITKGKLFGSKNRQRNVKRTLHAEQLEDRRVLAVGWNIVDIPNGNVGTSISNVNGTEFQLINNNRTWFTQSNGNPHRPQRASDSAVGGTLTPISASLNDGVIRDFRVTFPEAATGFQMFVISANEDFRLLPFLDNAGNPPPEIAASDSCYVAPGQSVPCNGGNGGSSPRLYATVNPNVPAYFDGVDVMVTNGPASGNSGPEEFDRFAYFVPGAQVLSDDGINVVSEDEDSDFLTVRLLSSLTRPEISNVNQNWRVVFDVISTDESELISFDDQVELNASNWSSGIEIEVAGVDDDTFDGNQTVNLILRVNDQLSTGGLFDPYADLVVPVTVLDNDVTVSASPSALLEDSGATFNYTITRSGDLSLPLTVAYEIGGTADCYDDFQILDGTFDCDFGEGEIDIPAGTSQATLRIQPIADSSREGTETIDVSFIDDFVVTPWDFTSTILADEVPDNVAITVDRMSISEGDSAGFTLTLTRTGDLVDELSVPYTLGGTAQSGVDYDDCFGDPIAASGEVNFDIGESQVYFYLCTIDDNLVEPGKTVQITFQNGPWHTIQSANQFALTITDDDSQLSATLLPDPAHVEEDSLAGFELAVSRMGDLSSPATVYFSIDGSAEYPYDYSASGAVSYFPPDGFLYFKAGEQTQIIHFDPLADGEREGDETIHISFDAEGDNYRFAGDNDFLMTIIDNDLVDGDFNDDGFFDCADIDSLVAIVASGIDLPEWDLTGDEYVDQLDLVQWLADAAIHNGLPHAYRRGDANLDGVVDGSDFSIWNSNKFLFDVGWCRGDFTADGVVDASDVVVWNANKFTSSLDAPPDGRPSDVIRRKYKERKTAPESTLSRRVAELSQSATRKSDLGNGMSRHPRPAERTRRWPSHEAVDTLFAMRQLELS